MALTSKKFIVLILISSFILSCSNKGDKTKQDTLGSIDFPNSGLAAAQESFERGVLTLHNYWYPEAEKAFRKAIEIDSNFALAYWGLAMSVNKTLWQRQDYDLGREIIQIIEKRGFSEGNKISDKEKIFLESLTYLYQDTDDKLIRDKEYLSFMESFYKKYPEDDEVAAFYALALLGVLRDNQGNENIRMECAAVAQRVLDRNPNHPGALHYKIHALDDPLHAVLALDAAYKYAEVAPQSNHALHMPSHIFVQLGMWEEVMKSNIAARNASENWVSKENLSKTSLDNHSLSWLSYAYTQLGLFDESYEILEEIRTNNEDTANRGSFHYELDIMSRIWLEQSADLADFQMDFDGLKSVGNIDRSKYYFVKSWMSMESNSPEEALRNIDSIKTLIDDGGLSYFDSAIISIYLNESLALYNYTFGSNDESKSFLEKAILFEESLNPPTGPPDVIKPIHELYGELLLKEGQLEKAIIMFNKCLERTPNRSLSQLGIARAYRLISDMNSAKYHYEKFAENYKMASNNENQNEALTFIKNNENIQSMDTKIARETGQLNYDRKYKITQCLPLN